MTAKPPLPDSYQLPSEVNNWMHDPTSKKNGHIWTGPHNMAAVGVFGFDGEVSVKVMDERVSGFARSRRVFRTEYDYTKDYLEPADASAPTPAVIEAVEKAVDWMTHHDPPWKHPDIEPAAFEPPDGYTLDRYYLEERRQTICYRRKEATSTVGLSEQVPEDEPSIATRDYLYVEVWRGSGNATVSLAPWLRAHDNEKCEVLDPPEECGLDIALLLAREWVAEHYDTNTSDGNSPDNVQESSPIGQTSLSIWE